ncbi:MAG: 2-oxoacid:ferredoxin oxidoreductase subunit beta [Candidatus Promineifilaceae bacterium]
MSSKRGPRTNELGLTYSDYRDLPSTLCKGCGHDSITSQIISVAFELSLKPHEIIRLSGIGCSSKSAAYFFGRSHGFNSLHGRMPSLGTGALVANQHLAAIGVSGDGDSASIGMGQFKHLVRRNLRMVYIIENNGVYGLTKGQFSATADIGQELKYAGRNEFPPEDLCMEAIISGCGFVARSFSGDPQQVRELLKAAFSHRGTAVLDIISPCVTFNNSDSSTKSYRWGKDNAESLIDIHYVPVQEEIAIEDFTPGETRSIDLHDGSRILLQKLDEHYDPTDRLSAIGRLETARQRGEFVTGLIYVNQERPSLTEILDLVDTPLAMLPDDKLRPSAEALRDILRSYT